MTHIMAIEENDIIREVYSKILDIVVNKSEPKFSEKIYEDLKKLSVE